MGRTEDVARGVDSVWHGAGGRAGKRAGIHCRREEDKAWGGKGEHEVDRV